MGTHGRTESRNLTVKGYRRLLGLILTSATILTLAFINADPAAFTAVGLIAGGYFVSVGVQKFKKPED